jgi:uncharacterized protein YlxW (UPF0749 family)
LREEELVEVLGQLDAQADRLARENAALETELRQLESDQTSRQAAREAAARRAEVQGILAGTIAAEGPGVTVTVSDPGGVVSPAMAYTLVDELRNAGAEAISVGPVRITASSYFAASNEGGGLIVDGELIQSPYQWRAIGEAETLKTALGIPGGILAAIKAHGASVTIYSLDLVTIDAVKRLQSPKYASAIE